MLVVARTNCTLLATTSPVKAGFATAGYAMPATTTYAGPAAYTGVTYSAGAAPATYAGP